MSEAPPDAPGMDRLVEQFRACLDSLVADPDEGVGDGEPLDLRTLLAELAALRTEVRLQARQFKTALEQTQAFGEALREQNDRLGLDLERSRTQAAETKAEAERGLLLGLLDLRDRLQAGLDAQRAWQPGPLLRLLGPVQRQVDSQRTGSTLTLQRVDDLLAGYGVVPLAALGRPFDPHSMHAAGVESAPDAAENAVVRELRRGFYRGGQLLRTAEVIVNRKGPAA
jgi:molecular chaperone GrpE